MYNTINQVTQTSSYHKGVKHKLTQAKLISSLFELTLRLACGRLIGREC